MDYFTIMTEIITLILIGLGVIVGLRKLNTLEKQVSLIEKQYRDNFEWEKRLNSIRYSGLYHPLIRESKQILQEKFNLYGRSDAIPKDDFKEAMKEDSKIQIHLNNILTYYENICLACRKKIADERIIFDMCGKTMYLIRKKLINYIEHHRQIAGNERLWREFDNFSNELYAKYYVNKHEAEELNEIGR